MPGIWSPTAPRSALAAFAAWLAQRPPTQRHTYGYGRVETLAALLNVVFMVLVVVGISVAAVGRILDPAAVNGAAVTLVAALGLVLNIAVAWLLMHGEQTMNTRGALLHVLGDLLGSVAALVSGAVVMWTGWMTIDPLLSMLICALMLASSLRLLREVLQALMEGVPPSLSTEQVGRVLAGIAGVASVHDLHIWTLSSKRVALSAHLIVESLEQWPTVLAASRHALAAQGITRDAAAGTLDQYRCAGCRSPRNSVSRMPGPPDEGARAARRRGTGRSRRRSRWLDRSGSADPGRFRGDRCQL
ncbi:cation diffusion facilitator family transporter [Candidatus Accumulibacter contiguus]|uniref:cation diffusion facilitator family transporter n=1 Tax=Candidatus Accumulibacter contiguus TaxID=2954381 RepID=UPI002FC33B00